MLVVFGPVVVLGVLAWLVVLAALVAPDCVPDAGQRVCYWSGPGADALQVGGVVVWSWDDGTAWRLDAANDGKVKP